MKSDQPTIGSMFGAVDPEAGFLGFPRHDAADPVEAEIVIIGAPCASPYRSVGPYCAGAPAAIRAGIAGYAAVRDHHDFDLGGPLLGETGARVVDRGDLPYDEGDAPGNRERIRSAVATILARGARPVKACRPAPGLCDTRAIVGYGWPRVGAGRPEPAETLGEG